MTLQDAGRAHEITEVRPKQETAIVHYGAGKVRVTRGVAVRVAAEMQPYVAHALLEYERVMGLAAAGVEF
jgi:hypothetical protein